MFTIFADLMTAARKQTRYRQTRAALEQMPLDTRLDLDLDIADFPLLARKAVWG